MSSHDCWHSRCRIGLGRLGFTLTELLVVIAIIGILTGIMLPVVQSVRGNARQSACIGNFRAIGAANLLYMADNRGYLNHQQVGNSGDGNADFSGSWKTRIQLYILPITGTSSTTYNKLNVFTCPETPSDLHGGDDTTTAYVMNQYVLESGSYSSGSGSAGRPLRMNAFNHPNRKVHMIESVGGRTLIQSNAFGMYSLDESEAPGAIDFRHPDNTVNVLFIDGHVENLGVPPLPLNPGSGMTDANAWLSPTALPPSR